MIYRRKTCRNWIAAWYIRQPDGKLAKHTQSTGTSDKTEARAIEAAWVATSESIRRREKIDSIISRLTERIHGVRPPDNKGFPLCTAWDKFATMPQNKVTPPEKGEDGEHGMRWIPPRTLTAKGQAWKRFIRWIERAHPDITTIPEVSSKVAAEFLSTLSGAATHNRTKAYLSSIWRGLDSLAGLDGINPWRKMSAIAERAKSYRDLSTEEIRALLVACDKAAPYWKYLVAVGYYTGLREIDCVMLRRSHFVDDGFIELVPTKTTRTKKNVRTWVHSDLVRILTPVIQKMGEGQDLLFPEAAERHGGAEFGREFGEILKRAEIVENRRGRVGFHSLRHAFVTNLEKAGVDRRTVQGIVGHGSDSVTRLYNHDRQSSRVIETALPRLQMDILECGTPLEIQKYEAKLAPTASSLRQLVAKYSNETIGQIYGMSGSAIHKWLVKFGIKRSGRVMSGKLDEAELEKIRKKLMEG